MAKIKDNSGKFSIGLSLNVKLILGFVVIIIILSGLNFLQYRISDLSKKNSESIVSLTETLDEINSSSLKTASLVKSFVDKKDDRQKDEIEERMKTISDDLKFIKSVTKKADSFKIIAKIELTNDYYKRTIDYIYENIDKEKPSVLTAKTDDFMKTVNNTTMMLFSLMSEELEYFKSQRGNIETLTSISSVVIFVLMGVVGVAGIILSVLLAFSITRPLKNLVDKSTQIAKGDLTVKFEQMMRKDEVGNLVASFSLMVDTLKNINEKIYVAIIILTRNLRTVFQSSNIVKDSANTQAVTVEQTHSNFESMNKMVETISNESTKANLYTDQALNRANVGMDSMQKLEAEMTKIESSSLEITNIIEMINEIAEQTNLLSLNASIESARAGEAGKGFNIVAGEIRKLAEKSTQAANRIHELITNNNKIIQDGVNYTKSTTNTLKEIAISNELIAGLVKTINNEVHKVKLSSQEILQAINHISNIAQANLEESEKVFSAMGNFVMQTLELQHFVGQFDIRSDKTKENQQHLEEILRSRLVEAEKVLKEFGAHFLPTGNIVDISGYKVQELRVGDLLVTGSSDVVDAISKRTNTSVTIFQPIENALIRVSTTVRNFDDSRAIGTIVSSDNSVYDAVMRKEEYYGRTFVVNRWYVAAYKPILDETGFILAILYLGISEDTEYDMEKRDFSESEEDRKYSRTISANR
jgi:methyl-accepting chemotaxis protein